MLAGGLGSRYRGLKQIDGITPHGESILEFSVYDALAAGFNKFVFIINRQIPETFVARITAALEQRAARAHWVVQEMQYGLPAGYHVPDDRQKPWGTGQAILCARDVIAEPFAVINADDFYGKEVYPLAYQGLAQVTPTRYQLLAYPVAATLSDNGAVARGICQIGPDGYLQRLDEQTNVRQEDGAIVYGEDGQRTTLPPDSLVSMNFWVFDPSLFGHLQALFEHFLQQHPGPKDEFYIPVSVQQLIAAGTVQVRVQMSPSRWMGVTYPGDKEKLVEFVGQQVAQQRYPDGLWG